AQELVRRRVPIDITGQALPHMIERACLEARICQGAFRGGRPTYISVDDRFPASPVLDREDAVAELARRFLAAYEPAGPADFAYWSGLPLSEARAGWQALEERAERLTLEGDSVWIAGGSRRRAVNAHPSLKLLPSLDGYLLGYRGRHLALAGEHTRLVTPGGGVIRPAIIEDGRVIGIWRYDKSGREPVVRALLFATDSLERLRTEIEAEAADIARFLGRPAECELTTL
ncbi:MAG: DNA glycosylase AlkZ-like family protein, partial [Candidatus Geothermincolia bacterium]